MCINTHGLSYCSDNSSTVTYETLGVVIVTLLFKRVDNVVAAVPILILAISPTASISASVSSSSLFDAAGALSEESNEAPLVNASISSCVNISLIALLLLPYN